MIDLPLHPIAVHFPIVLGSLLPALALLLWWSIRKEWVVPKAWALVPAVALVYMLSALVASELGEEDEDKVEKIVREEVIEEHEEAAEVIPWVAGTLMIVSLAGFVKKYDDKAKLAVVALSLVAIVPLGIAGHTGGELVYKYGAARAHMSAADISAIGQGVKPHSEHHDDD